MSFSDFLRVEGSSPPHWDEWQYYQTPANLVDSAKKIAVKIKSAHGDGALVLCALSKSGLPLATVVSILLDRPLLIFAIGEFFTRDGLPIIDVIGGERYRDHKWILIDSHVRTGETAKLAKSSIESRIRTAVDDCYVVADMMDQRHRAEAGLTVSALFEVDAGFNQLRESVRAHRLDESIVEGDQFWRFHGKHWPKSLGKGCCEPQGNSIRIRTSAISTSMERILLDRERDLVEPETVLLSPRALDEFALAIADKVGKIDAVLAPSVGGIPVAAAVCRAYFERGVEARFLFLGNNSISYYKERLKASKTVLLADDIVSSGSILGIVRNHVIAPSENDLKAICCLGKCRFTEKGSYLTEAEDGVPLYAGFV